MSWNHNSHYHDLVIAEIPSKCLRALDVGCGRGEFTRKLARHCTQVTAIDADPACLAWAAAQNHIPNATFVQGDFLRLPVEEASFDLVVAIATLHHLPLSAALERFRQVLRPGGMLVIVGLFRSATPLDYAIGAAALPISLAIRMIKGEREVGAPLKKPVETLREIRTACDRLLPGGQFRRRFFFRYSFVWRKPGT